MPANLQYGDRVYRVRDGRPGVIQGRYFEDDCGSVYRVRLWNGMQYVHIGVTPEDFDFDPPAWAVVKPV